MTRLGFQLLAACLSMFAVAVFAESMSAQGNGGGKPPPPPPPPPPIQYSVEYIPMPTNTTSFFFRSVSEVSNGVSTSILATGTYAVSNGPNHGFVYDPQTNTFTDIHTLLNLDGIWTSSSCQKISSNGIGIGTVSNGTGSRVFWFDFFAATPTLHLLEDQFPVLADYAQSARDINAQGDILINVVESGPPYIDFMVNPSTNELVPLFDFLSVIGINNSRVILGESPVLSSGGFTDAMRYDLMNDVVQTFPGLKIPTDINNSGRFCGWTMVTTSKPKSVKRCACRYGTSLEWTSSPIVVASAGSRSLNDQGDVAFLTDGNIPWLYHATLGQSFDLRTLVNDAFFDAGTAFIHAITNRDQSLTIPTPVIAGEVVGASGEKRIFILFAVEP